MKHGKDDEMKIIIDTPVTIQLAADTADIVLDKLNEISSGPLMVNLEASQTELLPDNEESKNIDANNK